MQGWNGDEWKVRECQFTGGYLVVQFRCHTQEEVHVERVVVCDERFGCGSPSNHVKDRCLNLFQDRQKRGRGWKWEEKD